MADFSGRPLRGTSRDQTLFVDRQQELRVAYASLTNRANVLVLGDRGSGKTSFVHRLRSQLERDAPDAPVALVNGRLADSPTAFVLLLRDAFNAWPRVGLSDVADSAQAFVALTMEGFPTRPAPGETQTLLTGLDGLRRGLPNQHAYVLVDDLPPESARTLFGRLRDELWELPLTWLAAADKRDRLVYTEPPADAFFGRTLDLEPLDTESCNALLAKRLEDATISEAVKRQVIEEARGNPRRLISLANALLTGEISPARLREQNALRAERLSGLSEPARRLVEELEASGPASPSDETLLQRLGWKRSRASQVFAELERNGLVKSASRHGEGTRPRKVYELAS